MGEEEMISAEDAGKKQAKAAHKARKAHKGTTHAAAHTAQKEETRKKDAGPLPKSLILGAVIVLAVVLGVTYMMSQDRTQAGAQTTTTVPPASKNPDIAEKTDIVTVEYTGYLVNGTVFDSSNRTIAEANHILNPLREYGPFTFTLGDGGLIKGFEEAILGMKLGQTKQITLPPEKAYGMRSSKLIQTVDRVQKSPLVQNVSTDKFRQDIGREPAEGLEFTVQNSSEFELSWPMKVLSVNNDTVTFMYMPGKNETINTVFGPAELYGTDTDIVIKVNPVAGQKIVTIAGPAMILDVNGENVTLDFNHELAGQTLKFDLTLTGIAKQR